MVCHQDIGATGLVEFPYKNAADKSGAAGDNYHQKSFQSQKTPMAQI
jgi:hypothetical protein